MKATTNTRQHAVHCENGGRDVLCQRLVQNSAWRECRDRLADKFLDRFLAWQRRQLPVYAETDRIRLRAPSSHAIIVETCSYFPKNV